MVWWKNTEYEDEEIEYTDDIKVSLPLEDTKCDKMTQDKFSGVKLGGFNSFSNKYSNYFSE